MTPVLGAPECGVMLLCLLLPAVRAVMLLVD